MNKLLIVVLIGILTACSNDKSEEISKIDINESLENKTIENVPFPHYESVYQMLEESYDYRPHNGSLVLLSKPSQREHVQVSQLFLKNEPPKSMIEDVKRDIVYVAFEAFALTDVNELTITSVPLESSTDTNKINYFNEFKKTVTVNRNTAKLILRKYFENDSFKDLFYLDKGYYLPSKEFDLLKFAELESVYEYLKN
ncbi:MAG TPA: hypothetical protein VLB84_00785 [Bacteroidia bacterium]|nr:hypothetical protein [Bacteroidia bacterium]